MPRDDEVDCKGGFVDDVVGYDRLPVAQPNHYMIDVSRASQCRVEVRKPEGQTQWWSVPRPPQVRRSSSSNASEEFEQGGMLARKLSM